MQSREDSVWHVPETDAVPGFRATEIVNADETAVDLDDLVNQMISQGSPPMRANARLILTIRKTRHNGAFHDEGSRLVTLASKVSRPKEFGWTMLMSAIASLLVIDIQNIAQ